jgi:tRNA (cmo5U34)-methyltransferase
MSDFQKTEWSQKEAAKQYTQKADQFLPYRWDMIQVVQSYFQYFQCGDGNRILDLGCGDGILSAALREKDSDASLVLVDGSETMLEKARTRLSGQVKTYTQTFQQVIQEQPNLGKFDFVCSAMAIHHLTRAEKRALYQYCQSALYPEGHLLVIDVVLAPTSQLEAWYLQVWREWIEQTARTSQSQEDFSGIPKKYKALEENQPDQLNTQLADLTDLGFLDVDVFFKFGIFTVFGGRKSPEFNSVNEEDPELALGAFDPGL